MFFLKVFTEFMPTCKITNGHFYFLDLSTNPVRLRPPNDLGGQI